MTDFCNSKAFCTYSLLKTYRHHSPESQLLHTMGNGDFMPRDYELLQCIFSLHCSQLAAELHQQTRTAAPSHAPAALLTIASAEQAEPAVPCLPGLWNLLCHKYSTGAGKTAAWSFYGWQVRKRGHSVDCTGWHCIALYAYLQQLENFEKDKKGHQAKVTFKLYRKLFFFFFPLSLLQYFRLKFYFCDRKCFSWATA